MEHLPSSPFKDRVLVLGGFACLAVLVLFQLVFNQDIARAQSSAVWSATDKSATISVSSDGLTATTGGSTSPTTQPQSVRSSTSASTGKLYAEVTMTTRTSDWAVGLANSKYALNNSGGLGSDNNGLGFYPAWAATNGTTYVYMTQAAFLNNNTLTQVSYKESLTSKSGDTVGIAVDFGKHLVWFTDAAMRAQGHQWNNSSTANPATDRGGLSFSSMSGPYYLIFNDLEGGGVATANFGASAFVYGLPSGFSAWGGTVITPKPTATLIANPTSITSGKTSQLTWSSTNANSCTGTNFSTGNAVAGTLNVSPTATTTYSVSCTGAGGSASANTTVGVAAAPVSGQTPTFDDEFNSLSLHRTWQQGDLWQLIAPDSPDGRGGPNWGEGGSQWWTNPYNPNTPISGIYSVSNGVLNLGLLNTPSAYQSYIDQQAGAHMPYVGGILNTSQTNYQQYGYWEFGMSCDKVPGLSCEISMENVQVTGHWPPQINLGVSTDASGNQTLQAHVYYSSSGASYDYSQPINGTVEHDFAVDWESNYITFYLDNTKVFQAPNPGGVYQSDKMFTYIYTGANYSIGTGVNPPASSLPAYAHIDYFRVYASKPSSTTPPPTPAPTASLSANPTSITSGQSSKLTWSSTNANSCTGTNFSTGNATSGSVNVSPTATTTYSVSCTGAGGTATSNATVSVSSGTTPPPTPAPTASLSANPTSITSGQSSKLTWSSTNANSCTGTNFSTGNATSGSVNVSPTANTTYSLSCTGAGGSASTNATVSVSAATTQQVVLTPTSGGSIKDSAGNIWTLPSNGCIYENGSQISGGCGTSGLTYVSSTNTIWGQDAGSGNWYEWNGSYWTGPYTTY